MYYSATPRELQTLFMQKTRLLWSIAKRVLHGRARPDAIGALICLVTILAVMVFICVQWVRALKVYLNYDQYTVLERPSTKPQGMAHVISDPYR